MFQKLFQRQLFPNFASFNLALALFAFNLFIICLVVLLGNVNASYSTSMLSGVSSLENAKGLVALTGLWSIGNTLLLLGFIDAVRGKQPKK